ncbi:unnamed protein product [Thelazia callipaeda]|uniref:TPR_REGION domain-containing protein n=1 Tax=Thelazia callipaeda TaxID=103827 RepID=A0A0N5CX05_THECL|nr:unnamed protein product [Thelazia callipaeda]
MWSGYCAFHAGDYHKAIEVYESMLTEKDYPEEVNVYIACCLFYFGMFTEAKEYAEKGPKSSLQNRLLFHTEYRLQNEKQVIVYESHLCDVTEDQLSLAAMHYMRSHYQQAIDIYKKILTTNKNFIAINVYLALCYYKLDYYDISLEVLQLYLHENPDSLSAINLKACNLSKLYNGKAAENELRKLQNFTNSCTLIKDIISHNTVVFREGDAALQVLPLLTNTLPEAKLNLIIFYLKKDDTFAAFNLIKDVDPKEPIESLLKAITHCIIGYQKKSKEHLKLAEKYFREVGDSPAERDTIVGRQAMASSYFLTNQFDEVLVYLNSIKTYLCSDDIFNFNSGQALLAVGDSSEAEASLLLVANEQLKKIPTYFLSLARAYIRNGKSNMAWEIYTKLIKSDDAVKLLRIIANDCYKIGDYYYSAKSFDALERAEPNPHYWEGKRGAVVGVFKKVIEQKTSVSHLHEAVILLEKSRHPQVEHITSNFIRLKMSSLLSAKGTSTKSSVQSDKSSSSTHSKSRKHWALSGTDPSKQVFANRSVYLKKIRYYGFDMDFTLAIYKSPDYDILLYNNIINRLVLLGYPEEIRNFPYEHDFAIRGLWFDRTYGNLLKVDGFGNILVGVHGHNYLQRSDIKKHYPSKFISLRHLEKVVVMNSLFDIAHTFVLITLIHYFDNHKNYTRTNDGTGVRSGDTIISYKSIAEDVLSAVNYVHNDSSLKTDVLQNLEKYIIKDDRIKPLLREINAHGGRTFLLTNSDYHYTNGILSYLIGSDWKTYFDVSIVDAKKPLWFAKGTVFRQIDTATGTPKIGIHQGLLKKGDVYAGGNSDDFRRLFNARDKEVLYIGDHIFGDVLKSKKTKGWRTFLVVPELEKEISIWSQEHELFINMMELTKKVEEMYNEIEIMSVESGIQEGNNQIREKTQEMDNCYSKMGSLFRSGPRTTFFASQVGRFADLYSSSCYNLLHYPLFYFFRAQMTLMPHEINIGKCIRKKSVSPPICTTSTN